MLARPIALLMIMVCLAPRAGRAEDAFESTVAPVLQRHCVACHGKEKQEGELRLDTPDRNFANARDAARWQDIADRIRSGEMPPEDQPPLPAAEAQAVVSWIAQELQSARSQRAHWAFQPLPEVTPPGVLSHDGWPRNEVDCFVLAKLQARMDLSPGGVPPRRTETAGHATTSTPDGRGLSPSPQADRVTLIRRVTLDLTGLPPTPEEVAAFLADDAPQAWERVVDRLLASPHYGERWGRHWLDLAQYADSSGFHNDLDRPHAWKYRDYVIRSFNEDKPFARFVAEQLAGDEVDGANEESLIATGFCRNGPSNDDNMGKTPAALAQYRADQLDNVISTASTVFLGLTIGCARCHNHKSEPLSSRDYYALLAIFNGTQKYGLVPGTEDSAGKKVSVDPSIKIQALVELSPHVPPTFVMRRGVATSQGEEVAPAVPTVLVTEPLKFPQPAADAKSSLRRRTFAEWIAAPDNPLTWRVLANRVWQYHFGRGLVATPSNLGTSGAEPSHPELLDWLAGQLVDYGGRIKPLHRLLLTSATYQQASRHRADAVRLDPENRLLWRMNLRRLEAESLRDAILAASGQLNPQAGGPGIKPRIRADLLSASQRNKWPVIEQENARHWRRSVYIYSKRQLLMPMMELFDAPTTTDSCAVRLVSVVPTQALVLMNDEFTEDQAGHLAVRATAEGGDDLEQIVERMFQLALSRPPHPERMREALAFVQSRERASSRHTALTDLAHVIFNSSDFVYVE